MIIHTNTFRYFWEVYENNEYSFLFDNLKVLDLGCSEGSFSLWIYPRAERIWAVDKDIACIDNFKETIRKNELKKITLFQDRVTDLRDFMQGHSIDKVDVLKIDIEDDELEVFSRDDFPIDRVNTIIGEYHEKPVESSLVRLGYRYTELPNKHFICRR